MTKDSINLLGIALLCAICMAWGAYLAAHHRVVIQDDECPEGKLHVITDGKLWPCTYVGQGGYGK